MGDKHYGRTSSVRSERSDVLPRPSDGVEIVRWRLIRHARNVVVQKRHKLRERRSSTRVSFYNLILFLE